MYKEISRLILFSDLGKNSILKNIAGIIHDAEHDRAMQEYLIPRMTP